MKSKVIKRSVIIQWTQDQRLSRRCILGLPERNRAGPRYELMSQTVAEIDRVRQRPNLSSAIRLVVLDWVRNRTGLTELREEKRVPDASAERGHLTTP